MIYEFDYFGSFADGIELIIALGSIMGFLGLVIGLLGAMTMSSRLKAKFYGLMVVSFILLGICGLQTGVRYFRIF